MPGIANSGLCQVFFFITDADPDKSYSTARVSDALLNNSFVIPGKLGDDDLFCEF